MMPVSQKFIDAATATVRRVRARATIVYTNPLYWVERSVTASDESNPSFVYQVLDGTEEPTAKWASLDGSWVLDGSYSIMPPADDPRGHQVGWWSSRPAPAPGGRFNQPYPTLTINYAFGMPIEYIRVVGDTLRGEWPRGFSIYMYDARGVLKYEIHVGDNTEIVWRKEVSPAVMDVSKVVLEIWQWSHAGRVPKIMEFSTQWVEVYEDNDILNLHITEEREVEGGSLPIGNVISSEIELRLNNKNRHFSPGNAASPIKDLLRPNRRIVVQLGFEYEDGTTEWVDMGTFWSSDWSTPEHEIWASVKGRDMLQILDTTTYEQSVVLQNATLYDLALAVLQDGLKGVQAAGSLYMIDGELANFVIPYAWIGRMTHREAIKTIAAACGGQVTTDRYGRIWVQGPQFLAQRTTPSLTITPDDYKQLSNPQQWDKVYNVVEVKTMPLRPADEAEEVYRATEKLGATETKTFICEYTDQPVIEAVARIENNDGTLSITSAEYFATHAVIEVSHNGAVEHEFELVIEGKPLRVTGSAVVVAKDDVSIFRDGEKRYKFPDNPLIQSTSMAENIASSLLAVYKIAQQDADITWRGNPALELADRVRVTDMLGGSQDYHIIAQSFDYDGGLTVTMRARRAA